MAAKFDPEKHTIEGFLKENPDVVKLFNPVLKELLKDEKSIKESKQLSGATLRLRDHTIAFFLLAKITGNEELLVKMRSEIRKITEDSPGDLAPWILMEGIEHKVDRGIRRVLGSKYAFPEAPLEISGRN